jgi:hypothetical protein
MFSQKDLRTRRQIWLRRIVLIGLALAAAYRLFPFLASGLRAGAGVVLSLVYLIAYLFAVAVLPLIAFALLKFAYSVFARPYVRLWRIQRIRNARYLKEAIKRGR